jgi:iron complex outermembrane receptor protein
MKPALRYLLLAEATLLFAPIEAIAQQAALPAPSIQEAERSQGQTGAQEGSPGTSPAEAEPEDVVVTGSRIARPEFAAPNPITSFDAAAIQQSGNTNVTTFLQRVPALTGSLDSTQTAGGDAVYRNPFGAAGLNELNLRNLGVDRTLVLVNGRRHVAGASNSAAVDINSIPTDLIERVDVLTGGASAVYGADGVSGVVNFILKRDFEGVSARAQMGISQYGDAGNRFVSIAAGHNFADGRANLSLAYEYSAEDRLENDARKRLQQSRRRYLIPNDADANDDPNVPDNILVGDLRYPNESFNGAVDVDGDGIPDFDGDGRVWDPGTPAAYYTTGGSSSPVAGFYSGDLYPKVERHNVNMLGHFDVSDAFKLSFEGKYAQTRATTFDFFTGTYGYGVPVANPYVPAVIRDAALAAGSDTVFVNRDNRDYGRHGESDLRRTYRGVVDVSGRISEHATYDAYVEYGRTDVAITKLNDRLADRFYASLDAVIDPASGRIVCRSNLTPSAASGAQTFTPGPASGCAPTSLFGEQTASPEALAFFRINDRSSARVTQTVTNVSISGDFGALFSLPGGPVQFSFGGEYRRETSRFDPSDNLLNARFVLYDEPSPVTAAGGKFDVGEAFGELNLPILADLPFAHTLSLGAAGRYSHYSTIGDTGTWQLNGVYAPVRDLTFRGSYGKSVRAPNIGELFQPATGTANFFTDPCGPNQLNNGSASRAANCQTLLTSLGAADAAGLQTGSNIFGTASGNAALRAETARTWTAGAVLRPRFLPRFTASIDWYDITLKGAINTPSPQQLAELCVDQPSLDNQFCSAITRERGSGRITSYVVGPQNVSQFRTAGLDLNLNYVVPTARLGTFDLRLVGGYLSRLEFIGTPGAAAENRVDQPGAPRWNATFSPTWTLGGLTATYVLRWYDATRTQALAVTAGDPDYAPAAQLRYKELWQQDAQLQYQLPSGFAFYGGVNNLADQKPDQGNSTDLPISPLGRFFYIGAKLALGRR